MKLLVCGGREYGSHDGEIETLNRMLDMLVGAGDTIIQGGAFGADDLAWRWWKRHASAVLMVEFWIDGGYGNRHQTERFDQTRARYVRCGAWSEGKHMGMARNRRQLDDSGADIVLAFPGGTGTAGMVQYARRQGVTVLRVER
jgi:hypothetical protein